MKKVLILLTAGVMAVSLAGCSHKQQDANNMPAAEQNSYQSGYSSKLGTTKKKHCKKKAQAAKQAETQTQTDTSSY